MMDVNNVSTLLLQNSLNANNRIMNKKMEMLASGQRINRASDDAAGLSISEGLRNKLKGLEKASANVQDSVSVLNIADGAMDSMTENLQRVRELAVQGANDTLGAPQRSAIQREMTQRIQEIDRIAQSTQFNGRNLFSGTTAFNVQAGPGSNAADNVINLTGQSALGNLNASSLGVRTGGTVTLGVSNSASALQSISKLDTAIARLSNRRASVGALTNRLESTSSYLAQAYENVAISEGAIRNTNIARTVSDYSQSRIRVQATTSLMSQSNSRQRDVYRMLR
jgi:flagellin